MNCPICGKAMVMAWEHSGRNWYSGVYGCCSCGAMKISGMLLDGGRRSVVSVIPECLHHGIIPVIQVTRGRWRCTRCETEITQDGSDLIRSAVLEPAILAVV
jgi:hypothetical protein